MKIITNAKIYTMSSEVVEHGYILIDGAKISDVGKMENMPENIENMEVIDFSGKVITPGFIDAHSHLGMSEDGVGEEGEDFNEMSDPVTSQVRALDAIDPMDICFSEAYNAGVTTAICSPGSANPIAGQIVAIKTFGNNLAKMCIKEPLAMKFAMGENPKRVYGNQEQAPMSRMATAAIIRENLLKANRYMEDKKKAIAEDSDLPEFDFKLECLEPVLKREIKAHFHAHRAYDIQTAMRIGKEFNLDYIIIHATEGHRIANILAEEKVDVVCGPLLGTRSKPELSRQTLENVRILKNSGVSVAISSDHPEVPVEFLPLSGAVLMEHGLTQYEVLESLTYRAAKIIGIDDTVGSIAKGLDADLLVFENEPLNNNKKPEMVFINGANIKMH